MDNVLIHNSQFYLDARFRQFRPRGQLFAVVDVWILRLRESAFEKIELVLCEGSAMAAPRRSWVWVREAALVRVSD